MTTPTPTRTKALGAHFKAAALAAPWGSGTDLVVGVSGGVDSMTLLYLLRFEVQLPRDRIHVAHFDHGMRRDSQADARWLAGVCRAWSLPFFAQTAPVPIRTEAEGREARYAFFHDLAKQVGAKSILTGHNADDQAETVLFRIARGSGPAGLAGVLGTWPTGLARPFLGIWRRQIEAFALARGVPYREDPTNRELTWSRNRLRHEVLPRLETVVPGASKALVALGQIAASEREALSDLTDALLDRLLLEDEGEAHLSTDSLEGLSDPVLTQLVRRVGVRWGEEIGREATGQAVKFIRGGRSGQQVDLTGGLILDRSFGRIRFRLEPRAVDPPAPSRSGVETTPEESDLLVGGREGHGRLEVGGRLVEVRWGDGPLEDFPHRTSFARSRVSLPLTVRPWLAGDRVRMSYGTKKVKKILAEKRVPHTDRPQLPVVVDGEGAVLWMPGVVQGVLTGADSGRERLYVGIRYSPEGRQMKAGEGS